MAESEKLKAARDAAVAAWYATRDAYAARDAALDAAHRAAHRAARDAYATYLARDAYAAYLAGLAALDAILAAKEQETPNE